MVTAIQNLSLRTQLRWINLNFVIRYELKGCDEVLISADKLFSLLGTKFHDVLLRLISFKGRELTIKPFHGESYTFYCR